MSAPTPFPAGNPPVVRASPFVGLNPYTPEDNNFFFGRDKETELITANLIASRLTLLYGPSGVGKSSVLQAGVIHGLQVRAREEIASGERPSYLVFYFNNWRVDPVPALLQVIANTIQKFLTVELSAPTTLTETLAAWTERTGVEFLIILDQFEEYFLYQTKIDPQDSIGRELPHVLKQEDLRVNLMLSFREDSLSQLDKFKGSLPNLFNNILRIKHLSLEAGRHVIQEPIYEYNRLRAADTPEIGIESELVEQVLNEVRVGGVVLGETGRGVIAQENVETKIEAPYLQLVMTRLWERERQLSSSLLRFATFQALGGAEHIVRDHLQKAMETLTESQQKIAASVFDRLVTPSGTKIAQTARDLAKNARVSEPELDVVLEQLAGGQNRILRPVAPAPDRPDAPRYEIFHDVLSGAILEWRAKYEKEQEQYKLQAELARERAEAEREAALKNEKLRGRRIQYALWGTIAAVILLGGLAVFAFQQRGEAQSSAAAARAEAAAAQTQAANARGIANIILTAVPQESPGSAQTQVAIAQALAATSQSEANALTTALAQKTSVNSETSVAAQATLDAASAQVGTAQAARATAEQAVIAAGTSELVRQTAVAASTSASGSGTFAIFPDGENDVDQVQGQLVFRTIARTSGKDGEGIDHVEMFILDASGTSLLERNELLPLYCAFGGSETCTPYVFAENKNAWPNGSPITDNGTYILKATIFFSTKRVPLDISKQITIRLEGVSPSQQTLSTKTPVPPTATPTEPATSTRIAPTRTPTASGSAAILPATAQLIYVSDREHEGRFFLYKLNIGTRQVSRITQDVNATQNFEPDYAPATARIAFMRKQTIRDGEEWNIFTSDLDGNVSQQTRSQFNNWHPAWSRDGKQLVFVTSRFNDNGEIYVDGLFRQRMTNNPATDIWPAWLQDGNTIVFSSNRGDPNRQNFQLYTLDANPLNAINGVFDPELTVKQLTNGTGANLHPRGSPDGRQIVYRHVERDTNGDGNVNEQDLGGIWIVNSDGSNPHSLTSRDALENYPTWSLDGKWISFSRWINGKPQIFVMTADGSNVTQLTNDTASNFEPSWVP